MREIDHRSRVAAEKREKMRRRLVECALVVFSRKGVEAAVIDSVIALAAVSRGSFYNYFDSNDALLAAVMEEVGGELFWLIDQVVGNSQNPLERIASAIRLTLYTAKRYPRFGKFFVRSSVSTNTSDALARRFLLRDLQEASQQGKIKHEPGVVLIDLVVGSTFGGLQTVLLRKNIPDDYVEQLVMHILLGLGVSVSVAKKLVELPLKPIEIPVDSLLERSNSIEIDDQKHTNTRR